MALGHEERRQLKIIILHELVKWNRGALATADLYNSIEDKVPGYWNVKTGASQEITKIINEGVVFFTT